MPLQVIATPIGNPEDISLRAIRALEESEVLIGEELKVTRRFIADLSQHFSDSENKMKQLECLNEHSDEEDLQIYLELCRNKKVALISDCGTPGFCDPGAQLVSLCRKQKIDVNVLPGASSLMAFLSGCGHDLKQFNFIGFLPAKKESREKELKKLSKTNENLIVMDTPYRLTRTLEDLCQHFPNKNCCLATELTKSSEKFVTAKPMQLLEQFNGQKLEFVLAILN